MSTFTLPSGQDHHFRERAFKRSIIVSIGIHVVILVAAGSMTLFRMSGTTYAPSYSVDLVSLPSPKPAKVAKPAKSIPSSTKTPPKAVVEKKAPKPVVSSTPDEIQKEMKPSGGDEAARLERRQKIEDLEMEISRQIDSIKTEASAVTEESVQPAETDADAPSVTSTPTGGNDAPSNIRFNAYYERIIIQIRSSWVVPEGITSRVRLVTVVGIRIAPNGNIDQYRIEKSSGNVYYDESLLRAIRKANPLPSLPDERNEAPLELGLKFNSQDMKW